MQVTRKEISRISTAVPQDALASTLGGTFASEHARILSNAHYERIAFLSRIPSTSQWSVIGNISNGDKLTSS